MDSGCDVYDYADNSSVVCAEDAVFTPRMRLWTRPWSVNLGNLTYFDVFYPRLWWYGRRSVWAITPQPRP